MGLLWHRGGRAQICFIYEIFGRRSGGGATAPPSPPIFDIQY